MFEEPTYTEEEEKRIWIEQNRSNRKDPRGFRCFIMFMIACLMLLSSKCEATGGVTIFHGDEVEWSQTWSCSCGQSNDESYETCAACGNSK